MWCIQRHTCTLQKSCFTHGKIKAGGKSYCQGGLHMCFCKCVYVDFLDPKTRGLAQAKIQLAELKMLPYAVRKIGPGEHVCMFSEHARGQGKGCQDFLVVSPTPVHSQDAGKIPVTFKEAAEFGPLAIKTALRSRVQLNYSNTRQMGLPNLSHNIWIINVL